MKSIKTKGYVLQRLIKVLYGYYMYMSYFK